VLGVGIGGHTWMSARNALYAAVLRPIGSRHPVKWIADLETELLDAINYLGLGPMGTGGNVTCLDLHIEYSYGHSGCMPVTVEDQCFIVKRSSVKIASDGKLIPESYPSLWFKEVRRTIPKKYGGPLEV